MRQKKTWRQSNGRTANNVHLPVRVELLNSYFRLVTADSYRFVIACHAAHLTSKTSQASHALGRLWAIFLDNCVTYHQMDFLLKVGQGRHIEDMYNNEYLFFNTFSSFRTKEKDVLGRNDPREANTINKQLTFLEITTPDGVIIKLSEMSKQFNAQFNESPKIIPYNICSLYTLTFNDDLKYNEVDARVQSLGNKTLIIFHVGQFFEILDNSLEKQNIEFSRKPVSYYDYKTFDGDLTFHHKENSFEYQNEYRILLQTPGTATINLNLPGLREISAVVDTERINTLELKIGKENRSTR